MRNRVSGRNKKIIIIISVIISIIALIAVVVVMNSLTRGVLNNDMIYADIKSVEAIRLTPEDIVHLKNTGEFGGVSFDSASFEDVKDNEICILKYTFLINNSEDEAISDISIEIKPDSYAVGKVYDCSSMKMLSQDKGIMIFEQYAVVDSVNVKDRFFDAGVSEDFEGPFIYKLSYNMEGQYGKKALEFYPVKQ